MGSEADFANAEQLDSAVSTEYVKPNQNAKGTIKQLESPMEKLRATGVVQCDRHATLSSLIMEVQKRRFLKAFVDERLLVTRRKEIIVALRPSRCHPGAILNGGSDIRTI